jgi:hypothetical protein
MDLAPDDDSALLDAALGSSGFLGAAVVRELTADDLQAIVNRPEGAKAPASSGLGLISRMRNSHHRIAQLLASGMTCGQVALMTRYAPEYINRLSNEDPAFAEILAFYRAVPEGEPVPSPSRAWQLWTSCILGLRPRPKSGPNVS